MATAAAKTKNGNHETSRNPNAPAVIGANAPPANVEKLMDQDEEGLGASTDQADNIVPLIYLLDAKSPQVNSRDHDNYIDGAAPGDIWLRNAPGNPIVRGDEGIIFQPCHFEVTFNEWVPRDGERQGGFVGVHKGVPPQAKPGHNPERPNRTFWEMPNGNEIIETRVYRGFVIRDGRALAYSLPFASTGHTAARTMMTFINGQRRPNGKKPQMWGCYYRLTTFMRTKGGNSWFNFSVSNAGPDGVPSFTKTDEEYLRGKALFLAFQSGEKKDEIPAQSGDGESRPDDAGGQV